MGLRRRGSNLGRSGRPIGRQITSEPASEELARLWQENAELRSKTHVLGKQKIELELELRVLRERLAATQKRQTTFRGIADVESL